MSTLVMYSCEGCGATVEVPVRIAGIGKPPEEWLVIEGPATNADAERCRRPFSPDIKRHVCSPACLVVLGERLAAHEDALQPVRELAT